MSDVVSRVALAMAIVLLVVAGATLYVIFNGSILFDYITCIEV